MFICAIIWPIALYSNENDIDEQFSEFKKRNTLTFTHLDNSNYKQQLNKSLFIWNLEFVNHQLCVKIDAI